MKLEFLLFAVFVKHFLSNFMKLCPVGAELCHADGKADITKLAVTILQTRLKQRTIVGNKDKHEDKKWDWN